MRALLVGGVEDTYMSCFRFPQSVSGQIDTNCSKAILEMDHDTFREHRSFEWQEVMAHSGIGISGVKETEQYIHKPGRTPIGK